MLLDLYMTMSFYLAFYALGVMHGDETGEFDGHGWKLYAAAIALGFAWPYVIGEYVWRKTVKLFRRLKARYGPR